MKLFKSRKRIVSMLTVLAMVLAMMPATAFAETSAETAEVCVTIADKGAVVMNQQEIVVSDIDGDGALTINDALYAAHEAGYEGGAAAGYDYYVHETYGLSVSKFWGSSACGYYLNDAYVMTPATAVNDGDSIKAWVYSDTEKYSDKYAYFDEKQVEAAAGDEIELTLYAATGAYDEFWMPVIAPAADAIITVDGEKTEFVTDKDGKVTVTIEETGKHLISAVSDSVILVPAVCNAVINPAATDETAEVYVTVSDGTGQLVMIQEKVTVADADRDGVLTINDALYAAHEAGYEGGAAAGYDYYVHETYGLSVSKFWGSSACGYYLNDAYVMTPATAVNDGDSVKAWVYTDTENWSDKYAYFNEKRVEAAVGEEIELALYAATGAYDESWMPVFGPVADAAITADGEITEYETDDDGEVTLMFDEAGEYILSAEAEGINLVPPVCVINVTAQAAGDAGDEQGKPQDENVTPEEDGVTEEQQDDNVTSGDDISNENDQDNSGKQNVNKATQTGDDFNIVFYVIAALAAFVAAALCLRKRACK